jgi:thiamine-phosphate pyrophosphorylase
LLLAQIRGAIAGGVTMVQIRERDLEARELATFVRRCLAAARASGCRIIVNDRLDVALSVEADGVHLRETSITTADARRLVTMMGRSRKFVLGRSVHDAGTAARSRDADYLIVGSVFETASKAGSYSVLGLDGLRRVVEAASPCPVWAIGGITAQRLQALAHSGVDGVAAIGAFLPPANATNVEDEVRRATEFLRFSLDPL